jgi:rubrerythrin
MGKTAHDIVVESLRGELQAVDFYLAVAEAAQNHEVKHLAQQFAAEEEKHLHLLVDWLEQDGDPALRAVLQEVRLLLRTPSREPAIITSWKEKYGREQSPDSVRALLTMAIAKEAESINYCQKLEKEVAEPLARRMLVKMCQDEERHKLFLEQQYEKLLREGTALLS